MILSEEAEAEINEIWVYNAKRYGFDHAEEYVSFLRSRILALATEHGQGRPVSNRPELRQVTMRQGRRGYGHIAIYRVTATTVNVLHVFHTAQDVAGRLADEG